ncbi:MAG: precorrin-2 dehydrogenase/sirohydrochlorin ferrochelatase family protein [Halobacteriota archaeon]
MIPLYHDFSDAVVLVLGGGSVGCRKARRFAAEARVVVVSPAFDPEFEAIEGGCDEAAGSVGEPADAADRSDGSIELIRAAPDAGSVGEWLDRIDPALVVIATDDAALNEAADRAAADRGIVRNRADLAGDRDPGSVVVPATVTDGPVSIAISTNGTSPAVSKHLRGKLESEIEGAGAMASLTAELRERLKADGRSPAARRAAVRAVVRSDTVWKALHTGDTNPMQEATRVIGNEVDVD